MAALISTERENQRDSAKSDTHVHDHPDDSHASSSNTGNFNSVKVVNSPSTHLDDPRKPAATVIDLGTEDSGQKSEGQCQTRNRNLLVGSETQGGHEGSEKAALGHEGTVGSGKLQTLQQNLALRSTLQASPTTTTVKSEDKESTDDDSDEDIPHDEGTANRSRRRPHHLIDLVDESHYRQIGTPDPPEIISSIATYATETRVFQPAESALAVDAMSHKRKHSQLEPNDEGKARDVRTRRAPSSRVSVFSEDDTTTDRLLPDLSKSSEGFGLHRVSQKQTIHPRQLGKGEEASKEDKRLISTVTARGRDLPTLTPKTHPSQPFRMIDQGKLDHHLRNYTVVRFHANIADSNRYQPRTRLFGACNTMETLFGQARAGLVFGMSPAPNKVKVITVWINKLQMLPMVEYDEEDFQSFVLLLKRAPCWKVNESGQITGTCEVDVKGNL